MEISIFFVCNRNQYFLLSHWKTTHELREAEEIKQFCGPSQHDYMQNRIQLHILKKEYKTDNPTVSLSHIIQFKFIPILIFLESNYFNVSCNPRFNLNLEVEERIGNHNISLNKSHLSSGFCQDWKGFWRKCAPKLLVVELYG